MSTGEQKSILNLIDSQSWAKQDFEQLRQKADQGNGYSSAYIYALTGDKKYLTIAKSWLTKIAQQGGDLGNRAIKADKAFFNQGMPWLGDVYYYTNTQPLQAYDLIYNALTDSQRHEIEAGLEKSAAFRKNAMDTWWQTANLVFKPTSMTAIHGLLTQNPEFIEWGFFRKPGSSHGGVFSSLNSMLKDNGPWHEAPTYAVLHRPLSLSLEIADYLGKITNLDWFARPLDNGNSIKGFLDYYINTTYPAETRFDGSKKWRILTYGDGATSPFGDLYLQSPNYYQRNLSSELSAAYRLSFDPDYAAFLKLDSNYKPNLISRLPLPESPLLPHAPSGIWEEFGIGFLRSNQSNSYWHDKNAIAASLLFRQGYGHGHADALSITLFAAGALFYPDYNPIQYENPAVGWTSNSIAHNTVVVDGGNSDLPKQVDTFHLFKPKLSVIKSKVDEPLGLTKTRTLIMTQDYMLDVFNLDSIREKTFDYLLHSFASIQPDKVSEFYSSEPFSSRYAQIKDFKANTNNRNWRLNFSLSKHQKQTLDESLVNQFINDQHPRSAVEKAFGLEGENQLTSSNIKFEMTEKENTKVGYGIDEYGLSFLMARRENQTNTTFVSTHSPFYSGESEPQINPEVIIDSKTATVVKVSSPDYTDFHAISYRKDRQVVNNENATVSMDFTDYGFIRVNKKTQQILNEGNWHNFQISSDISGTRSALMLGDVDENSTINSSINSNPIQINTYPSMVILKDFEDSWFTLSVTNISKKPLLVTAKLGVHADYQISTTKIPLGIINSYKTVSKRIQLGRYSSTSGIDLLPISIQFENSNQTITDGLVVSVGPGLSEHFDNTEQPVYRIHTYESKFDFSMRYGLVHKITDAQGNVVYSGQSLFDISDSQKNYAARFQNITTSYTWPNKHQASLITQLENLVRWHTLTIQDKFYIKLDDVYTTTDQVLFRFDKRNRAFDWKNSQYLSDKKTHFIALDQFEPIHTQAIEIPLVNTKFSLCLETSIPTDWLNSQDYLSLPVRRDSKDQWNFSLCNNHSLNDSISVD